MTRGKYAVRAINRREREAATNEIQTYQRVVRELTTERDSLRQQLTDERERAARERRVLRAQLNEGISPELSARDAVIEELREEVGKIRGGAQRDRQIKDSFFRLLAALLAQAGFTWTESMEWILRRIPNAAGDLEKVDAVFTGDVTTIGKLSPEAVERIQRVRGERS